jgi:hypothetical protein
VVANLADASLSKNVKRTCDSLRQGATRQITDYEMRFSGFKNLYDGLLENLVRIGYDFSQAYSTAKELFGSENVRFAAVDGTMYSRPLFDMVIFFGGAYASTGSVTFTEDVAPRITYDPKTLEQSTGVSSVVPVYINEIPDLDTAFSSPEQPSEINPGKLSTDQEIANNSMIANAIMTFGEYFLAYKLASNKTHSYRIILMDRGLSTDRAILLYETRKTEFWDVKCSLKGYKLDDAESPVDQSDLAIARHVFSTASGLPPPRANYLRYSIIDLLKNENSLSSERIASSLGISDEKRVRRIERALKGLMQKQIVGEIEGSYSLDPKYVSSWERMKQITLALGENLFLENSSSTGTASSMKIVKSGKEHWLTTLDISFLTLFTMHMLMEECWKQHILLVGITKDTTARDFKRQLVPIMQSEGMLKAKVNLEALQELPNTDRMILQSASIFNADKITPPWSLIEYDSAFRSILPDQQSRKGYVCGAIKNKISLERTFLKTYVQLSIAKSDPMLRSNVLLIDRLAYPEFDLKPESTVGFVNELSDGTQEPVNVLIFRDNKVANRVQNLVMSVLVAMAPMNIPEAFGHNKPLFIADKVAKWNYGQFKRVVDTTALWILNNHKLRKFIFYMSTFRERRSQIEQTRRESV